MLISELFSRASKHDMAYNQGHHLVIANHLCIHPIIYGLNLEKPKLRFRDWAKRTVAIFRGNIVDMHQLCECMMAPSKH